MNQIEDKQYEQISISHFPNSTLIELPADYRKILFGMIHIENTTVAKINKRLTSLSLKENFSRWRGGYDGATSALIPLKPFLELHKNITITRNRLLECVTTINSQIANHRERIPKSKEIMFLIISIRTIFQGNNALAAKLRITPNKLRCYVRNQGTKTLPKCFVEDLIKFAEEKILCYSFSYEEIQNNILSYKAHHGKKIIPCFEGKRTIPIMVTPEFESIIFHLMGDGHVRSIGSSEYTQINAKNRKNFLYKLFNSFGDFEIPENSYADGRVLIPKIIINIICDHYSVSYDDFKWNVSKMPLNLHHDVSFKVAALSAFIVDEGHVSNRGIELYSSNKSLLSYMRNIVLDLDLFCSLIKNKKPHGSTKESYRFRIPKESSVKFLRMVELLEKEFPYCGLGCKQGRLFL